VSISGKEEKLKMRILMVGHAGKGGMYAYIDALCDGLCANGADVTVLASPEWPEKPRPFKIERRLLELVDKQQQWSQVHWAADRLCRCLYNSWWRNRFGILGQYDVVHLQGGGVPLIDQFLLKPLAKHIPIVATIHDVKPHYERIVSRVSFLRRSFHIPHRLIVHYEDGKRQLSDDWGVSMDRIDVIPHGIMPLYNPPGMSDARKKLNLPSDRRILLFFGGIRPNKGLDILLRALRFVRMSNPQVLLVIAGFIPRGMSFEPYSSTIERLDLLPNVRTFVEFIAEEDVDYFFAASDLVVLPYLKFEAQSGVLLRAYAHKKPVVVSNVGAMGQLVSSDKVGLVVEPGSPESLAEAIIGALGIPEKFMSQYSYKLEKKYNWQHIGKLSMRSYEMAIINQTKEK
jgi:glycosyltransferase involved in cell wall biosynthesis